MQSQFKPKPRKLKKLRRLLEKNFNKSHLLEEAADRNTNRSSSIEIREPSKGYIPEIKNVIQTFITKADSFQAGNTKNFPENWKKDNLGQVHSRYC